MMAKIVKGSDFKGVVNYILDKDKNAQVVAYEGLFMENRDTIAMSFNAQSQMNGKVTKPVGHIALSFSKEDEPRLTNRVMAGIALEYMERMGIRDIQFFIARHFDKEHPHVHVAFNRIDNNGNTISDYCCPIKKLSYDKIWAGFYCRSQPFSVILDSPKNKYNR